MLKWAVGQRNPTPGQPISSFYSSASGKRENESSFFKTTTERLHVARRRNSRSAVRKAAVRSLTRIKHDKENRPCLTPENALSRTRDNSRPGYMALRDVSNSPDPYVTPRCHSYIKRRQSHPLNLISKKSSGEHSKSAPANTLDYLRSRHFPDSKRATSTTSQKTPIKAKTQNESFTDVVDMRKPNSTIKSLLSVQIEYSPGPLAATQSLVSLRQKLTKSLTLANHNPTTAHGTENPLYYALNQNERCPADGITISGNEQSPTLEALMEEKSLLEQVSDKYEFRKSLKKDNLRIENSLVSSLSERLEWLRLNNSFNSVNLLKKEENQVCSEDEPDVIKRKRRDVDAIRRQKSMRGKMRKYCDGACKTGNGYCCDKIRPKTLQKPKLMGLTLPLGIPSPITSEDSGLYSLGLEGIHPLSSSPTGKDDLGSLSEEALSKYRQEDESVSTSLIVEKCSPSSICSSLRKRLNENEYESRDAWSEEVVPLVKTPKLRDEPRTKGDSSGFSCDFVLPSPLALVEKRSRSRRCLRFVSPGNSSCQRHLPAARRPLSLSCPRLRDGREGAGELELSVSCTGDLITVHVGRGTNLHRPSGNGCNAYVKVALVPSTERTFFRTPVHRESNCPNFNEKFSFKFHPEDLSKQILVSVWHRDRDNRKSEFLGCVSLAVKNAIKKEISGSFHLVAQSSGSKSTPNQQRSAQSSPGSSTSGSQSMMARRSGNAKLNDIVLSGEEQTTPEKQSKSAERKKINDDSSFLRHLELEPVDGIPLPEVVAKGGRTPFTTTKLLTKQRGSGFGFSIAWVHPPRVERVEAGQSADRAGIRPGDFVIFVDRHNVVMMSEEQILQIIKSSGNELTLEIYRKTNSNGIVEPPPSVAYDTASGPTNFSQSAKWSAGCSATTSASLDFAKRRFHLPQVAFTNEGYPSNPKDSCKKAVYQLLNKEQNYATNLQFGIDRFLIPLSERKEFLNSTQHHILFQNIEEILRLTEDILESVLQEEIDSGGNFIGKLYDKRLATIKVAYRKYCSGIKRADCLLAEKSKNTDFNRFCAEPPIPQRRPDLTTFLHKPLEHYRELLQLLQAILNLTKSSDLDHFALTKVVSDMQATFREVTGGLMEPDVEGRPLLSVQDVESRLVFTRCKPFVLSVPGRQWIFGGDLSRVEGRTVHPFWALLFTDMMVFAKVSRDRVLFITEEPLSLLTVSQAFFNIRKRANEFRLLLSGSNAGADSPASAMCGPDIALSRTPKKNSKYRSIALRAPTPELKAVWQNLIQRQIIYLNTTRGLTPTGSPLESPDLPTTLSAATLDSMSLKRQVVNQSVRKMCLQQILCQTNKDEKLIHEKRKQLTEATLIQNISPTNQGERNSHVEAWMKDNLNSTRFDNNLDDLCSETSMSGKKGIERTEQIPVKTSDRIDENDLFTEKGASRNTLVNTLNQSQSTSGSQITVKSNPEKMVSVCRECHETCLNTDNLKNDTETEDEYEESWGSLLMLGMRGILPAVKTSKDPFELTELPSISVLPPTPDKKPPNAEKPQRNYENRNMTMCRDGANCRFLKKDPSSPILNTFKKTNLKISMHNKMDGDAQDKSENLQHTTTILSTGLRRFGTLTSLEKIGSEEQDDQKNSAGNANNEEKARNKGAEKVDIDNDNDNDNEGDGEDEEEDEKNYYEVKKDRKKKVGSGRQDKTKTKTDSSEVGDSLGGWTVRAGSFVAAKMAFFERLSSPDNTMTVRKTTFLERYLKPSSEENHLESPDLGTNTSSSGRGEDEGETSGATSGEEVWGTPTSGGDFEEELADESCALSFYESPRGSIPITDDTEQLMEDLLLRLPMLAMKTQGITPKRILEPLLEEEGSESSSTPCTPEKFQDSQGSTGRLKQPPDTSLRTTLIVHRPQPFSKGANFVRLKKSSQTSLIYSDDEEEAVTNVSNSTSIFRRLGIKRNTSRHRSGRKCKRLLGFLSGRKLDSDIGNRNSATYGAKPLFRYLFNRDSDDDIPTSLPRGFTPHSRNEKQLERRFWKQLRRRKRKNGAPKEFVKETGSS